MSELGSASQFNREYTRTFGTPPMTRLHAFAAIRSTLPFGKHANKG